MTANFKTPAPNTTRSLRRHRRQVDKIRILLDVSHEEACDLWSSYFEPAGYQIRPIMPTALTKLAKLRDNSVIEPLGRLCPYCKDRLYSTDARSECSACSTTYHEDCFVDYLWGRCGTIGCPSVSQRGVAHLCGDKSLIVGKPAAQTDRVLVLVYKLSITLAVVSLLGIAVLGGYLALSASWAAI